MSLNSQCDGKHDRRNHGYAAETSWHSFSAILRNSSGHAEPICEASIYKPFHLARYIDEQVFRYNNRKHADKSPMTDAERFTLAMKQVAGRRLTYTALTGKR